MTAKVRVRRLRANASGCSYFEAFEIECETIAFAPPALPFPVSKPIPALRFVLLTLPSGWIGARHPTPARQMLFCLSGSVRVTPAIGEPVVIGAGDAWLMEDTTGDGHETEVVSAAAFEAVVVQLPPDWSP